MFKNANFDQRFGCAAAKRWSKYTALETQGVQTAKEVNQDEVSCWSFGNPTTKQKRSEAQQNVFEAFKISFAVDFLANTNYILKGTILQSSKTYLNLILTIELIY